VYLDQKFVYNTNVKYSREHKWEASNQNIKSTIEMTSQSDREEWPTSAEEYQIIEQVGQVGI